MHILKYLFVALAGLALSSIVWADMPPMIVTSCLTCHGPGGSSVGPATPSIAAMDKEIFVEMMEEYQTNTIPSTIMNRIVKGYVAKDFEIMANYFAKQKITRYPQVTEPTKVAKGAKLHKKYCEKCHEENGYDNESAILAGQWMPYLQFSLDDFHSGKREMSKKMKKRLRKMLKKHGEDSLENIIHFYGSQK